MLPALTEALGFNTNITLIQVVNQQGKQNYMDNRLKKKEAK